MSNDSDRAIEPETEMRRTYSLEDIQRLHAEGRLDAADARAELLQACIYGHLPVVRFLFEDAGVTADDTRADNYRSLIEACRNKRSFSVLQYLFESAGTTADDARDSKLLYWAALGGHTEAICYLRRSVGLTIADICVNNQRILATACLYGRLGTVRCLFEGAGLTVQDVNPADSARVLRWARSRNNLDVARYLIDEAGMADAKPTRR